MEAAKHDEIIAASAVHHNRLAVFYDRLHPELWNKEELSRIERLVANSVKSLPATAPARSLDLGAGTGFATEALLEWGFAVDAVDVSVFMLKRLKKKFAREVASGRVRVHLDDADTFLRTVDLKYSLIIASVVMNHLPDPRATFDLMTRRLIAGGSIIIFHEPSSAASSHLKRILQLIDRFLARLFIVPWNQMEIFQSSSLKFCDNDSKHGAIFSEAEVREAARESGLTIHGFERYSTAFSAPVRRALEWLSGPTTWSMVLRKPR
jgi:SAM-dependent methyltransferase